MTQIIYDNEGTILSIRDGFPKPKNPVGVPFLEVEIPSGKQIKIVDGIGVDVTVTPHQVILENIPPSETEVLKQQMATQEQAIADLTMYISML